MKYKVTMDIEAYQEFEVEAENPRLAFLKAAAAWEKESAAECRRELEIYGATPCLCEDEAGKFTEYYS